jgi:excinuclease ABC subunit A
LGGKNIYESSMLVAPALKTFLVGLRFDARSRKVAEPILREALSKLESVIEVGLDYIALNRDCATLSGGELQRLRLATAMGSPLSGVMYIFDEPSVGLHPEDNLRVLARLVDLRDRGNSVVMIEHDSQSIMATDHVIDVGPGGGIRGGRIVYSGPTHDLLQSRESATARAIREEELREVKKARKSADYLTIENGNFNNVHHLALKLPLRSIVTVAGVSGAGKSSLVHGIIARVLGEGKKRGNSYTLKGTTIASTVDIDRVLLVDQKPIGANSRSTPASYLKIWDDIRKLFASAIESKALGWTDSFFSYNTGKGRCSECKGQGRVKLEMSFLADAHVTCESCNGTRYGEEAASIHYLGSTISEVLSLTFEEALVKFANHRRIHQAVKLACDLGLGYLTIGQGSSTLSGGESQRLKLVAELKGRASGHTLYILDEPTTGLHKADVAKLMDTLEALIDRGNSVLLIEHDADVLKRSDYLLEMGPGAAERGGTVIFQGTPAKIATAKTPWGSIMRGATGTASPNKSEISESMSAHG